MKNILIALIVLFLGISTDSFSQLYGGASIGSSFVNKKITDLNGDDFKIDENAFAYKIFAGYSSKFIGLEGGYRELGKVETTISSINLKSQTTGWDVAARGKIALGPVIAFAKAGAIFTKAKTEFDNQGSDTENSTDFLWGLGAGLKLGFIGVRLEYESIELGNDSNLAMLTLGATIHFGGK